jgi:uncharacterized membrane protein
MEKVERTIIIHAPVEAIFDYISEPMNLLKIWPDMVEVEVLLRSQRGDHLFRCEHKIVGVRIESTWETFEHIVNERIAIRTSGGIRSTLMWTFRPENGNTQVTFYMEYTIPAPLMRKRSEDAIRTWHEHEVEAVLTNLKAAIEEQNQIDPSR